MSISFKKNFNGCTSDSSTIAHQIVLPNWIKNNFDNKLENIIDNDREKDKFSTLLNEFFKFKFGKGFNKYDYIVSSGNKKNFSKYKILLNMNNVDILCEYGKHKKIIPAKHGIVLSKIKNIDISIMQPFNLLIGLK